MLNEWWTTAPEYVFLLGLAVVVALVGLWIGRRR